MNPPTNSFALSQPFMANRLLQKQKVSSTTSLISTSEENIQKTESPIEKQINTMVTDSEIIKEAVKEGLPMEELDKSGEENNEFQELLDIIYDNKPINIVYGKDRRTQITPAVLTGKKDFIYEHEIPSIIRKSSEEGYKDMLELNFKQAMINFKKSENIINVK